MPYPNPRVEPSGDRTPAASSRRSRALPGFLFVLLVLAVWADPLFFRRSFAGRDLIAYNLPLEKGIHDAYARGAFPLWQPEISGGRPLLPNPNAGALYPVRMLLAPLRFPVAVKFFPILHWAFAGLGIMVLLTSAGASRDAGWIGAVTYAFSGVAVSDVYFPHVLPGLALLPWIVWAAGRRATPASRIFLLSLLLALDMLAGDVFTIGIGILCAAVWIGIGVEPQARRAHAFALAGAIGLAALAALPQIVATALWLPETHRAVTGIDLGEALQFSLSPYRLLELVVPFPFGSVWATENTSIWGWKIFNRKMMGLFLTLYSGALGFIALVCTWKNRQPLARFGRLLVFLALLLAVPGSLVPESLFKVASPLPLRNPEKFAVMLAFGIAILAGVGLDELRRRARLPRWIFAVGVGLAVLAALAALFPRAFGAVVVMLTRTPLQFFPEATRELPMALTEAAFLWVLTWVALDLVSWRKPSVRLVSLALLTMVPVVATHRIPWTFREEDVFAPPTFVQYQRKHDPEGRYRTLGEMLYRFSSKIEMAEAGTDPAYTEFARRNWMQHAQALWNRGTVFNGDFDNGDLSRIESVRKVSAIAGGFKDGGPFFENFSLRWGIRFRDQVALPGYQRIGGNNIDDWDENPGALPDIRLALGWIEEPGAIGALQQISKLKRGQIVIESGREGRGEAPSGSVRILENAPERLRLETNAPAPTWLFVLRGFWRHRTVLVDGRETEVFPAQLAFSAIPIPAGSHVVDWREHFPGWSVSRVGPILYVLCLGLLFARARAPRGSR
ncbi:MAG: hypothetical protein WAU32_16000 [Thermoanaerobaculia bacterium]